MRCHFGLQYTCWKGRTQGEDGDATTVRQWLHSPFYRVGIGMSTKTQILISLIGLGLVDTVIPIPIAATILIYVTLKRPAWFAEMVRDIYGA
jgi:hypothetical protein